MLHVECFSSFHFNKLPRRSAARKSFSTAAKLLPAIELRATKTNSTGWANSCWCNRKLSRSSRRARLRTGASPIFLLVTTPSLGEAPAGSLLQLAMRQPSASRSPCCRTRAKSRFCASRDERPKRRRGGAGFTNSNRREAFAAHAPAVGQRGLAALGGIAVQKPVLAFPADFRRLILAFHKFKSMVTGAKTGA